MFDLLKISKWANTDNINLKNCFEYNFRIIQKNEFYCSKCECNHKNKSQDKIISLPKELTIILNRGKGKKNFSNKINFYEIINIQKYVDDEFIEPKNRKYNYRLIGVSTYIQPNLDKEHYYAYCYLESENKYYCFNDTRVTKAKFEDLNDGVPYILFYEQIDDRNYKNDKIETL